MRRDDVVSTSMRRDDVASTLIRRHFEVMCLLGIRHRFDGKLFKLKRLQAKSKVQTEVLDEFLFADDIAKGASTEEKMPNVWIRYLTWKALQGAYHHSERSMIATDRQVHLPWKHIVKSCAYG